MFNKWHSTESLHWKFESGRDYVEAVQVTPCDLADGASNRFLIEKGSIYLGPQAFNGALSVIGNKPFDVPDLATLVFGLVGYCGIDRDTFNGESYVQIGRAAKGGEPHGLGMTREPDYILHGNKSLDSFVRESILD